MTNENEKAEMKIQKNSSIELLRIIAIIGVVILHYNNIEAGGGFKYVSDGTINQYYLYFTENMFICAVNLFIMISAYFLSVTQNRRFVKVVELIIQVIAFRVLFYILSILSGSEVFLLKSFLIKLLPANYFVVLYSVLYLISPYINLLLDKLSKEEFKKLIILLISIFSVWTIMVDLIENITNSSIEGLSTIGMYGSQYGYSIVNFILVYFIGAYIRRNNISLSPIKAIYGIIAVLVTIYVLSISEHFWGLNDITTWNYNNPLLILMAGLILLLFLNMQFFNKVVNELARAAFTCFLIHIGFLGYMQIEKFVNENIFILILHQFGVAVLLYLVSYVVYKIYYICSHWFIKLITPICDRVNISIVK